MATTPAGEMPATTLAGALPAATPDDVRLNRAALLFGYVGLVLIYLVFGLSKFTPEEAAGLVDIVRPSPFLGWAYGLVSTVTFSKLLGVLELSIGALIAARLISPRLSLAGGLLSAGLFLMTQSLLLSTPGAIDLSKDVLHIAGGTAQFLLKDMGLFAVSLLVAAESLGAVRRGR